MTQVPRICAGLFIALACIGQVLPPLAAQEKEPVATFSSGVALVPINAVVRDGRRRLVRNLAPEDFQVLENGRTRPIVDFRATNHASISLGLLFDTSGSMRGANFDTGTEVVEQLLETMDGAGDEMALFTFDKELRQETNFGADLDGIRCALDTTKPWGMTSLYDAIAATAKRLRQRPTERRAVVVISDGIDTSSELTSAAASALASEIDVPVYVIAVVPEPRSDDSTTAGERGHDLSSLAAWTGGDVRYVPRAGHAEPAVTMLMAELRHQYFFAIESAALSGHYSIDVRTRRRGLSVRARSGYVATAGDAGAGG